MQQGAYDYIEKPLNAEKLNRLKALIPKAIEKFNVQQKNRELTSQLEGLTHYGELTGQSEAMREVYQIIDAVAPSTASVLILGESGTGKELVARAVHSKSERAKGPFFALNCAALPKEILENELFGHEKGAFTGSTNEKPGAFEMASGGTIFLDEVAEMSPDIQVKLLRALETRHGAPARRQEGDSRSTSASSPRRTRICRRRSPTASCARISTIGSRSCRSTCRRFASGRRTSSCSRPNSSQRYASQNGKQISDFDTAAWDWILSYHWPGNVRELKNAVERVGDHGAWRQDHAHRHHAAASAERGEVASSVTIQVGATVSDARRQLVLRTFASTGGDLERTAKLLGVDVEEVRRDLLALVNGCGAATATRERTAMAGIAVADRLATPRPPAPAKKNHRQEALTLTRSSSMSRYEFDDDEPYVVIERHSDAASAPFLIGLALGAGVGAAVRAALGRGDAPRHQAPRAARATRGRADVATDVTDTRRRHVPGRAPPRRRADRLGARRRSTLKQRQVHRAMDAGRAAAHEARDELEQRIAETKAAYNAGAAVARERARRVARRRDATKADDSTSQPHRVAARMAKRPFSSALGWTLRDYAKRVWDNSGEDNVLFLAGGIAFNLMLAALPFILLLAAGVDVPAAARRPSGDDQLDADRRRVHRPPAAGAHHGPTRRSTS